jgi:hypothetical protein
MSIILRNLGNRIITRGLGSTDDTSVDNFCIKQNIDIQNHIYEEKEYYPLTGTFSKAASWRWNVSYPQDLSTIQNRIENSLGGYSYNLQEGTIKQDWKGCVIDGIKLHNLIEIQYKTKIKKWLPVIKTGNYSIYNYIKKLYSNYSCSELYNPTLNNDGLYTQEIKEECLESSLTMSIFKRDKSFINIPYRTFIQVNEKGNFNDYEFFLSRETNDDLFIYTDETFNFEIGKQSTEIEEIQCLNEYLGVGKYSRSIAYLEYFPCKDLTLQTIYPDGTLITWTKVDSFYNSRAGDTHYILENHTGKIVFNTYEEENNVCYLEKLEGRKLFTLNEIDNYPEEGVLLINNNIEVEYYSKGKYVFYLKENISQDVIFKSKIVLISRPRNLKEGEEIYVNYTVIPRIDYEVYEGDLTFFDINLKPYTKEESNGVLQISAIEKHVSKLQLTTDLSQIFGNIYGPLYMQGNSALLFARALNNINSPVEDIKVTFTADEGLFESETLEITKITNLEGTAQTSYSYPYEHNGLSLFTNVNYIRNNSYFDLENVPVGLTTSDISVFQVLKTDPYYGSYGLFLNVTNQTVEDNYLVLTTDKTIEEPYEYFAYDVNQESSPSVILENICNGNDRTIRNYGFASVFVLNNLRSFDGEGKIIIYKIVDNKIYLFLTGGLKTFLGMNTSLPLAVSGISIFKRNEVKWNPVDYSNGNQGALERIIYKYNENLEEPQYEKLLPSRIVGNRIYFDDILLPQGSENDSNNLIAGYKIFYPKLIKVRAFCTDPATGRTIFSNFIKIKVDFPEYLKSTNGFRIKDDITEESAGLGGANFITINPKNIYQINFMIENENG